MKKSLALFCALLAAALVGSGAAAIHTAKTAQQVETRPVPLAETELSEQSGLQWSPRAGRDAAADLQLQFQAQCEQRLRWDFTLNPAAEPEHPETKFYKLNRLPQEDAHMRNQSLELYACMGFGTSVSGGTIALSDEAQTFGFGPAFEEVAENTPAGQEHSQVLDLSLYMKEWPMTVGFAAAGQWLPYEQFWEMRVHPENRSAENEALYQMVEHLVQSFRFPIKGHPMMEFTVQKDESGAVVTLNAVQSGEENPTIDCYEALLNGGHYLILEAREGDGSLMDYSHTPGGYGIYRLPVYGEDDTPAPEDLQFFYELNPEEKLRLFTSDESNLLLVTEKEGQVFLKVLDETGSEIENMALGALSQNNWVQIQIQKDLVLLLRHGPNAEQHSFTLLRRTQENTYQREMDGVLPGGTCFENVAMPNDAAMAFDGSRFALAAPYGREYRGDCGYSVLVYDAQGLLFGDARQTSLSQGPGGNYQSQCHVVPGSMALRFADPA